ncbi:MAG: hypothetical protein RL404_2272 [Pseudomonadota bacterium]
MRYVTSIERLAKEEGLEQGMQQGQARLLARLLAQRFGHLPSWAGDKLASATEAQLEAWTDALLTSTSIDSIFEHPPRH